MKHAKRMILVPEDVFARFEQKQRLETSPVTTSMMHKDDEMSKILERTDIKDAEKQKLYYTNLERYLNLRQQKDGQIPTVQLATSDIDKNSNNNNDGNIEPVETELSDSIIVESIPKTARSRAAAILKRLKTRPDIISWDKSGQVSIDGADIPHSNISDLIGDAVRGRKYFNPTGSKQFFRVLSKNNVPKDLVRNDERWKQVYMSSLSDEEDDRYGSPKRTAPSKYFRTLLKRKNEGTGEASKKQAEKRWLKYP
jgi:hypothetical protein